MKKKKINDSDIIEKKLKKIIIVKLHESNCKIMKSEKNIHKKILKNKATIKPNDVVKTRE